MTPFDVDPETKVLFDSFMRPDQTALTRLLIAAGIQAYLDAAMPALAKVAREEEGQTWADVGEVLQVTRQAAYQRLGKQPFAYFDGKGGIHTVDPDSETYRESLRAALAQLEQEPGREAEARLIADYLAGKGDKDISVLVVPTDAEVPVPAKRNSAKK